MGFRFYLISCCVDILRGFSYVFFCLWVLRDHLIVFNQYSYVLNLSHNSILEPVIMLEQYRRLTNKK